MKAEIVAAEVKQTLARILQSRMRGTDFLHGLNVAAPSVSRTESWESCLELTEKSGAPNSGVHLHSEELIGCRKVRDDVEKGVCVHGDGKQPERWPCKGSGYGSQVSCCGSAAKRGKSNSRLRR